MSNTSFASPQRPSVAIAPSSDRRAAGESLEAPRSLQRAAPSARILRQQRVETQREESQLKTKITDTNQAPYSSIGAGTRAKIFKSLGCAKDALGAGHPAHAHIDTAIETLGGRVGDGTDLTSPGEIDRTSPSSAIRQTSAQPEPSHYDSIVTTGKSASGNTFQKAAKSTTSELIARVEALTVKAAAAKDDGTVQKLVELKELLKARAANEMSDEDWEKYGSGDRGAVAKAQRRTVNRWQPLPPHFSGGRRSGGRRTFAERHAG